MRKFILILALILAVGAFCIEKVQAETSEPVVKIEIPASSIDSIDVKYETQEASALSKAKDSAKETTDKTITAAKNTAKKTVDVTKNAADKTVKATKNAAKKTTEKTKDVTDKTVQATKNFTDKTADSTKGLIDDLNPNKPVTLEGLETKAQIKTLKNEKKELKAAYNSRIKDINAKVKAAEKSTVISDVQRQNKIYNLNKEKQELELQKDAAIEKYDTEIAKIKNKE